MPFLEFYSDNILLRVSNMQAIHLQEAISLYMQFVVCTMLKILKLFKLYIFVKSRNLAVYKIIYKC